jgi:hypothetical protein
VRKDRTANQILHFVTQFLAQLLAAIAPQPLHRAIASQPLHRSHCKHLRRALSAIAKK